MKDPGLNKAEHFIVCKMALPMIRTGRITCNMAFFDSFWPHCAARIQQTSAGFSALICCCWLTREKYPGNFAVLEPHKRVTYVAQGVNMGKVWLKLRSTWLKAQQQCKQTRPQHRYPSPDQKYESKNYVPNFQLKN